MSEADTPNNQPLPEPTASIDDSPAELSDVTEASESPQIVHLLALPGQTIEAVSVTMPSSTPEADEGETEIADTFEQKQTKDADWLALAQKMRQRNRRLLDQVTQLKAALKEKQEALHSEVMRSRDGITLLAQQTEELNTAQEQLTRLFHALESSHQAAVRQQILIETLSEQLQSGQERVAQLERECAITQQRYNEQSHQLLQAANTCRELRTRLHRQQRQTLQFKAALEKCLEVPPSHSVSQQSSHPNSAAAAQSLVHKAQPIQPWSAEPEVLEDTADFDTIWNRPIPLEPLPPVYPLSVEPLSARRPEDTDLISTVDSADPTEDAIASSEESAANELELEQQLLAEMTFLAEASGLSELPFDLANVQSSLTVESGTDSDESDEPASYLSDAEETPPPEDTRELDMETQTPMEDYWEDAAKEIEPTQPEVILPQSNWPSPVLYPLRPPKKLKSLAAIELPSFPRPRPS